MVGSLRLLKSTEKYNSDLYWHSLIIHAQISINFLMIIMGVTFSLIMTFVFWGWLSVIFFIDPFKVLDQLKFLDPLDIVSLGLVLNDHDKIFETLEFLLLAYLLEHQANIKTDNSTIASRDLIFIFIFLFIYKCIVMDMEIDGRFKIKH
ncbi:MAG: hypothetical protein WCG25_01590 [bacterium]